MLAFRFTGYFPGLIDHRVFSFTLPVACTATASLELKPRTYDDELNR